MKPIRAPNKTSLKLWGKITEKHKKSIWLAKSLCKCIFQVIANLGQRKGTSFLQLLDLLPTCGYEYYQKFTSKYWLKAFLKVFIILGVEISKVDPLDFVATGCSKLFHRDRPTGRNRRLLELDCNRVEYCIFYLSFEFEFWAYSVCNSDQQGETEGYWN